MALQKALSRLRNKEDRLNSNGTHQTKPITAPAIQQVTEVRDVFSLEESGSGDIFDVDNDIFSSADAIFSTSYTDKQHSHQIPYSNQSSPSPPDSSQFSTSQSLSLPRARRNPPPPHDTSTSVQTHSHTRTTPQACPPSPRPLQNLKTFSFTSQPSNKRNSDSSEKPHGFIPPTKRLNPSISSQSEQDIFDKTLLEAFISDPEEMECTSHSHSKSTINPTFKKPAHPTNKPRLSSASILLPPLSDLQRAPTGTQSVRASPLAQGHHHPSSSHRSGGGGTPGVARDYSLDRGSLSTTPSLQSQSSPFSTPQPGRYTTHSVRRKFPGPAGILPALAAGQSMDGVVVLTPSLPTPASTPRMKSLLRTPSRFYAQPLSQGSGDPLDFSQGPWVTMLQDLDMNDEYSAPLLKYTIARAVKQASQKKLRNGKVTHLRVLLKSLVPACRNTSAVLKDPSGEILCTIHQAVMDDHRQELQPGAVLILRQVTVFSPAPRKHYLSITPDNIVAIYPSSGDTSNTLSTTARTICLTEVEKRFRDEENAKENSPRHPPQFQRPSSSSPFSPPPSSLTTGPQNYHNSPATTAAESRESVQSEQVATACPGGQPSQQIPHSQSSVSLRDNSANRVHSSYTHISDSSVFSGLMCEDEFDAILGCIDGELDF